MVSKISKVLDGLGEGIGFALGLLLVSGLMFGVYAFVEPTQGPTVGGDYLSASSALNSAGGGFSNCEYLSGSAGNNNNLVLTCSAGKEIRDISHDCSTFSNTPSVSSYFSGVNQCGVSALSSTSLTGSGDRFSLDGGVVLSYFTATIICCDS